jgi:hypothetical protein
MNKYDLISDIALLTTTPEQSLRKLCDKSAECICHNVLERINDSSIDTTIDISIGELKIIVDGDEIHYKFSPSESFEEMLVNTILNKKDPLVTRIEDGLINRILSTYKDLI